jgi:16S rRNA C1402 (ribose-2'-O) methylase RsmI
MKVHIAFRTPWRICSCFRRKEVCIGRELTKIHEEYLFGTLSKCDPRIKELGEFVIVVAGAGSSIDPAPRELTR